MIAGLGWTIVQPPVPSVIWVIAALAWAGVQAATTRSTLGRPDDGAPASARAMASGCGPSGVSPSLAVGLASWLSQFCRRGTHAVAKGATAGEKLQSIREVSSVSCGK